MRIKVPSVAVACLLGIAMVASAATFEIQPGFGTVRISGPIVAGDKQRLLDIIFSNDVFSGVHDLQLNSPGGSVQEALAIADVIRTYYLSASVNPRDSCASACFFLFLAGTPREASKGRAPGVRGKVGLHRPYLTSSEAPLEEQERVMHAVSAYLGDQMVSRRLIDQMMARPSNDIYWLTTEDFLELGPMAPAIEERLIRKCNYDRRLWLAVERAVERRDASSERLMSRFLGQLHCQLTVLGHLRQDAYMRNRPPALPSIFDKAPSAVGR